MINDRRISESRKSIVGMQNFLNDIIHFPEKYVADESIIMALRSQGAFAKINNTEFSIAGTSLNTVKRVANSEISGGFIGLDSLRLAALDTLKACESRAKKTKKITVSSLTNKLYEVDRQLQQALQDLWHLTMVFEKSLKQGRRYAEATRDPVQLEMCNKEQRELRAHFSLLKHQIVIKN